MKFHFYNNALFARIAANEHEDPPVEGGYRGSQYEPQCICKNLNPHKVPKIPCPGCPRNKE